MLLILLTSLVALCDLTVLKRLQLWHHFSANLKALLRYTSVTTGTGRRRIRAPQLRIC